MTQDRDNTPDELATEIKRCKSELGELWIVLQGTVTERHKSCGKMGCRCKATPPALHGPYYQWTRKVRGKTQTVRLKADDVTDYERWIAAGRRFDQIIARWRDLAAKAVEQIRGKS